MFDALIVFSKNPKKLRLLTFIYFFVKCAYVMRTTIAKSAERAKKE